MTTGSSTTNETAAHYLGMNISDDAASRREQYRNPIGQFGAQPGVHSLGQASLNPSRFTDQEREFFQMGRRASARPYQFCDEHGISASDKNHPIFTGFVGDTCVTIAVHPGDERLVMMERDGMSMEVRQRSGESEPYRIDFASDGHAYVHTFDENGRVFDSVSYLRTGELSSRCSDPQWRQYTTAHTDGVDNLVPVTFIPGKEPGTYTDPFGNETLSQRDVDERFSPTTCCFHSDFDDSIFEDTSAFLTETH